MRLCAVAKRILKMGDILGYGAAAKRAVLEQFKTVRDLLAPGIDLSLHGIFQVSDLAEHPAEAAKGRSESEKIASHH